MVLHTRPARAAGALGSRVRGRGSLAGVTLTPFRITLVYLALGTTAVLVSDVVLVALTPDPLAGDVQALAGGLEVALTAGLIFGLTRLQQAQLDEATESVRLQRDELTLLHRVVRHNLRNDLNVIYGFLATFEDDLTSKAATERLEKLRATLSKMESYIEDLHRIKTTTEPDRDRVTVDLGTAIPRWLDDHPRLGDDVDVTVSVPGGAAVTCNHMVGEAVQELVTNAVEHAPAPTTVDVTVDPADGPRDLVAIHVTDDGPGLPAMEVKALEADGEPPLLHSTGLGLWFVDWVATHSGGELSIDDEAPEGTRVTLSLPAARTEAAQDLCRGRDSRG